jgi:hypothetical protein
VQVHDCDNCDNCDCSKPCVCDSWLTAPRVIHYYTIYNGDLRVAQRIPSRVMSVFDLGRRRLVTVIASAAVLILIFNLLFLTGDDIPSTISHVPIPSRPQKTPPSKTELYSSQTSFPPDVATPSKSPQIVDSHPIARFMKEADQKWREYESGRSTTFRQTVEKYRSKYGRHPPPGFKEWYKYARKKNVFNIDDFDQIMDDLRPFWALEPKTIRMYAAHMWENEGDGIRKWPS